MVYRLVIIIKSKREETCIMMDLAIAADKNV
jgi:hypothetical protein